MPENFSLRQPTAAPSEWTHSATIPPKTGKAEPAISSSKDNASSLQLVDVDVRRRIARSHRYRFMQGMMANEGTQRAGRAEIVSRPVQTPEQVNQMVEELARMRNVGKEQLYQEILSPETYQYASLYDPDFKVHLFPVGNKQGLLLVSHDENGRIKEVRSGVTLDYVLTQLPELRQSCSVAQDDGVRIQMVEDGLPSRCDRNGKAIYINQADVPPCVNTEQDKALYLVSVLRHELTHYESGFPIHNNVTELISAREFDEGLAILDQLRLIHENPRFTHSLSNLIRNGYVSGNEYLRIYSQFLQKMSQIDDGDDEKKNDLENEAAREIGQIHGDEVDQSGVRIRDRWKAEYLNADSPP